MHQTQHTTQTDADELFTSRLYAGVVGSGKSTTIGHDIRQLLDSDTEYRVIDVSRLECYDRPGLKDEYGTFGTVSEAIESQSKLRGHVKSTPYTRIDAQEADIWPEWDAFDIVVEHVLTVAIENDHPSVLVWDGFHIDQMTAEVGDLVATGRAHNTALWATHQHSARPESVDSWVRAGGEIVLHSDAGRMVGFGDSLSDEERTHVSRPAIDELGENRVLVGRPGQWRKDIVRR